MLTDIDKLHAAINDPNTWMDRGTGKTTIIIHQLAGQIQLGNYDYIGLVINFSHEFGYLWPMIHSIFEEQRIKILELHYDKSFKVECAGHKVVIQFFTKHGISSLHDLRGKRWYLIDMETGEGGTRDEKYLWFPG